MDEIEKETYSHSTKKFNVRKYIDKSSYNSLEDSLKDLFKRERFLKNEKTPEAKDALKDMKRETHTNVTQLSQKYTPKIYSLVVWYLIGVGALIFLEALLIPSYRLNSSVLIAILTTTTINVLGLLYLVLRNIFEHMRHH